MKRRVDLMDILFGTCYALIAAFAIPLLAALAVQTWRVCLPVIFGAAG